MDRWHFGKVDFDERIIRNTNTDSWRTGCWYVEQICLVEVMIQG